MKIRRPLPPNPLSTLEELRELRNPRFVPEPEFTRFDVSRLGSDCRSEYQSQDRLTQAQRHFEVEYPIPVIVSGLPWRYAQDMSPRVVPDPEVPRLDLSHLAKG